VKLVRESGSSPRREPDDDRIELADHCEHVVHELYLVAVAKGVG